MTNASIKNLLFGISVLTVAAMLSLGAFATTVHAADAWESYDSIGGGWDSYDSYSGGWDSYDTNAGSWDSYDTANGWDSYDTYGGNSYDVAAPDYGYDVAAPDYGYDVAAPDYGYDVSAPDYGYDVAAADYGTQYQQSVYQSAQGYQYSTGSSGTSYHATPMTIVPPTYYSNPSYPVYPTYPVQPPVRPQPTPVSNTTVTTNTNTCTNNSCNTSYTDNSINGSFNTAPIYQATAQPIIQYVQPIQAPFCTITIGQGYTSGMVNLIWSSSGATSAYITPSVGTVNVNGTTNVYSYGNTVYSLTVTGQGGTYTCRTQAYVAPTTPYVSLSQIPYTGFDFGTFGNAMYWLALLSFAVAGAYLVVYYQGGALALAGNMLGGNRSVSYSEHTVAPTPVEVEVVHEIAHEAPIALFNLPTMSATSTKDSMTVAHTADGVPRIVITRN